MRLTLGDGYVDALFDAYRGRVPDNADYVMYWWHRAAELVRNGKLERFGLITTNSLPQIVNRRLVAHHLKAKPPLSIVFAIPDHPWYLGGDMASVRIAMTVGIAGKHEGRLYQVVDPRLKAAEGGDRLQPALGGIIQANLRVGADLDQAALLRANTEIAYWGVKFYGDGFIAPERLRELAEIQAEAEIVRPFVSGQDLTRRWRGQFVVDCDGLTEEALRTKYPNLYQHLLVHVKPIRAENRRSFKRKRWWIFGENQPGMRTAVRELNRYIATTETAQHRLFQIRRGGAEG